MAHNSTASKAVTLSPILLSCSKRKSTFFFSHRKRKCLVSKQPLSFLHMQPSTGSQITNNAATPSEKKQNPMTSVETMFVSKGLLHTQEIITGGLSGGNPAGRGKQVREMTSDKTTVAADLPTQVCFAVWGRGSSRRGVRRTRLLNTVGHVWNKKMCRLMRWNHSVNISDGPAAKVLCNSLSVFAQTENEHFCFYSTFYAFNRAQTAVQIKGLKSVKHPPPPYTHTHTLIQPYTNTHSLGHANGSKHTLIWRQ